MGWVANAVPKMLGNSTQKFTATASSQQSNAVGGFTRILMLTCMTANVHYEIGPNPIASATTSPLLKATDPPLFIGCAPGDKVAVIQDSSGGVFALTEMTF